MNITLKKLEEAGQIDPNCKSCQTYFYPQLERGMVLGDIFAPRHKASSKCESGKYAHCTCDRCF